MSNLSYNTVDSTISAIKNWRSIDFNAQTASDLLLNGIIVYGATCDEELIPHLVGFYDVCTQLLNEHNRYEIYQQVNALLMSGKISTNALFPILFREPNAGIVSAAAIDYVQLTVPNDNDMFISVNNVASWITSANVANKSALFAGLINLGDKRISDILDDLRDRMSTEEVKELCLLNNGYPTLGAFEFWLNWLESTAEIYITDDERFKFIVAGLARLVLDKKIEHFSDVERHYGYRPINNEPSLAITEKLSCEQVGHRYAERLFALESLEPSPKMMSIILNLYGLQPRASLDEQMAI